MLQKQLQMIVEMEINMKKMLGITSDIVIWKSKTSKEKNTLNGIQGLVMILLLENKQKR